MVSGTSLTEGSNNNTIQQYDIDVMLQYITFLNTFTAGNTYIFPLSLKGHIHTYEVADTTFYSGGY